MDTVTVKVKLKVNITLQQATTARNVVDWGGGSVLLPGRFTRYPLCRRLGEAQGLSGD